MTPPQSDATEFSSTRLTTFWDAKFAIVGLAIVAAVIVFGVASVQPAQYRATATVRVALPDSRNAPREAVLAANDLAAQYAQLASSQPVLLAAAATLPENQRSGLSGSISASPIDNYNIIGITASDSDANAAALRASAVAKSLVTYIQQEAPAAQASDSTSAAQLDAAISRPSVTILDQPQTGSEVSNRAVPYAVAGLVVALIVATEINFLLRTQVTRGSQPRTYRRSVQRRTPTPVS
jgi:capsular polysaccharide biosynthesis protein